MIAIVDYGVGNLFSLRCSLSALGQDALVTGDARAIRSADRIILPGVGAFGDAAQKLRATGLADIVKEEAAKGKLLLGICLGMQLLLDQSEEYGVHPGLSLIPGQIRAISSVIPADYKIPHMGWNALRFPGEKHPLFRKIREGDCVYFVHSFAGFDCERHVIATAEYGAHLTAAVARGNVMGTQFHPEKSGEVGLKILQAFCEMKEGDLC